jgi:hypothetical protein
MEKARLCAQGFTQVDGVDCGNTFAPVAKFVSFRVMLTTAASQGMEIHNMDVDTAFLLAPLEEDVYMRLPDGFGELSGTIVKLNRALYGLKQSPRAWYSKAHSILSSLGFATNRKDPCLYTGIILHFTSMI